MTNLESVCIKEQIYHFADKGLHSQRYSFSGSLQVWELDRKVGWTLKNWCFQIVVMEKTLDSKEIKPGKFKGDQPWIFIGRTDAEAEAPIVRPLNVKANSLEKTLMWGETESKRRSGRQRMRWFNSCTDSMDMNLSKLWEIVKDREASRAASHKVPKNWTWLSNWIETTTNSKHSLSFHLFVSSLVFFISVL